MAKDIFDFLNPPKSNRREVARGAEFWKTNPAMAIVPTIIVFFSFVGISYALSWNISKLMAGAVSAAAGILYIIGAIIFSQMNNNHRRTGIRRK